MNNNLRKIEKELRAFAKRCKDIKYNVALLFSFLVTGSVSLTANGKDEVETARKGLQTSIADMKKLFKEAKQENNKLMKGSNLELIQLMEQGDHVVKSPWSSWQYGMNYFYSDWRGVYKGRGDKKEKYPYEGIFERSSDLFLRNISPDSDFYETYTSSINELFSHPATTSTIKKLGGSSSYGLASIIANQEPIASIELGASVKPKNISKIPVTVTPPTITVNAVTPLNTPGTPEAPEAPVINIKGFNPTAPEVTPPVLQLAPTFNIKLGSYRNYMTQNFLGDVDGGRNSGDGKSYNASTTQTIDGGTLTPTAIYAWASPSGHVTGANFDSALLKAYFDYTTHSNLGGGNSGGGTITVTGNMSIDSIRGSITDPDPVSRPWNNQGFLIGGSRIATLDNARGGGTIVNKAVVNMAGPLVVGYEIQNDNYGTKKREVTNLGTLTDDAEKGYRGTDGLGGLQVGKIGGVTETKPGMNLRLAPNLGGTEYPGGITISRTPDVVDSNGNIIPGKEGGYVGYKIGLILTHEFDDSNTDNNYYRLINGSSTEEGIISFKGKSSIGIQVYAPPKTSPNTRIEVINEKKGKIILGGIESYGLKLSSRILEKSPNGTKSIFENRGIISIEGDEGNSLSSGIAVLEDTGMTGSNFAIRAFKGMVKNKGTINVSGGKGNTGIILKVNAADDITNDGGTINVSGTSNIGMRVDKGAVNTDAAGNPEAINDGIIDVSGSAAAAADGNVGMVAHNQAKATNKKKITFSNSTKYGTGMLATGTGASIENTGTNAEISGSSLERTIGMSVLEGTTGTNSGKIELDGTRVTGVYNEKGTFIMTGGSLKASGDQSISLYSKDAATTTNVTGGKVIAGSKAVGLYADDSTIGIANPTTLEAEDGGLMFYNYASNNTTNPSGRFNLTGNIDGDILSGGTAFYFKGAAANTAAFLNQMFNNGLASSTGKLKLKLNDGATLFVLDSPGSTAIQLSTVSTLGTALGNKVDISRTTSNKYKAYTVYKGTFEIDKNVNLDDDTDDFYKMEFTASNVTVDANKTISGGQPNKVIIAQSNYSDTASSSDIKVINKGKIDYSGIKSTALATDFGEVTNDTTGTIKMSGDESVGLYGAANSIVTNKGTIEMGKSGVGIWGANNLSGQFTNKNINIVNSGIVKGITGKEGVFGIYADNDTTAYSTATSTINHSGIINLAQNKKSVGIYMTNGDLTSTGDISVKEESVGVDAANSNVTVNGGTYTVGKESVGFKLTNVPTTKSFLGNSGNLSITDTGSVAYLISGSNFESGVNFTDNLTLTSTDPYTYMNVENSTLKYENTKTIANDDSIFINAAGSNVTLKSANDISSTNKTITGVYSTRSTVKNEGKISLTGDGSSALYAEGSTVSNESTGKITIGKEGSGIYVKSITTAPVAAASGTNHGEITIGEASVGMRAEDATVINETTGKITSTAEKATGMSQSGGSQDITNKGIITLTGDKSTALHSEGITTAGHKVINTGDITVGDSSNELTPSVGIYSANGTNSTVESSGKVIAGNKSTAIYAGNVNLTGNSETKAGDGGIGVYSREGNVNISANSEITVGATLGNGKEGVGVYLAGNNQVLNSDTNKLNIGQGSFGYVMTGQGNNVKTGLAGATGEVTLSDDSVYMYSADKTGIARNYANVKSTGNENYGIYALGAVENYGNIDFSNGIGNVGAYSYVESATSTPNAIKNYGVISVSKSDLRTNPNDKKYGIGMAAGFSEEVPVGSGTYVTRGLGNIENHGTIKVTDPDSIGMYATGAGSKIVNAGTIELSGPKRNIGIFAEHGAEVINTGTITTVGTGNVGQIGVAIRKGATLNNTGTIHIDASKGYGAFVAGGIIINRGNITVSGGAVDVKEITAADTSKEMQDTQGNMNRIKINAPAGVAEATIVANGVVQTPTVVHVQAIPNRKPNDIPTSSLGMYIDTSGINYTRPITNIGALAGLTEADLIIGTEATQYTTSKYIQLGQDIIDPYNDMIRASGIEKWSIYSGSLTWMASITQLPDYTIRNAYLAKIPYTVFAGNQATPVDKKDTYNFLDGLEQRYGVEAIGTRENKVFQKLNSIGNNEEILFHQATDEMMGHQYANVQQRIQATGDILNKEFNYLRSKWQTASKDSNKIKTFGTRGEYKTDTAGVIDYKNHAYGVAYVHEDETVRLGEGTGWYAGIVHNTFKFKDIGNSREEMLQGKVGIFKSVPFDENNSLNWIISGDISVGYNKIHRRFLVVDEVFGAKGRYRTYGIGVKNEIAKEFRLSETFTLKPYAALSLEYGRMSKIREKSGEIKLEVKSNDYFSIRPEIGAELAYKQYFGRKTFKTGVSVAYENELGRVANGKNKARVAETNADWFNIRGEKEDRRGNVKADLNIGVDNQRIGVTANVGYDTKGSNIRGGLGLRVIF